MRSMKEQLRNNIHEIAEKVERKPMTYDDVKMLGAHYLAIKALEKLDDKADTAYNKPEMM